MKRSDEDAVDAVIQIARMARAEALREAAAFVNDWASDFHNQGRNDSAKDLRDIAGRIERDEMTTTED